MELLGSIFLGGFVGFIAGAYYEAHLQRKREAERKRKSRAKLKARKAAFVPCGGRELFTK